MKLRSQASLQILRPPQEVYQAIIDPSHMTKYFISESSGSLEDGVDVLWKFPEFDERFAITDVSLVKGSKVSFVWDPDTVVNIVLHPVDAGTVIDVTEGGKAITEDNIRWLVENTGGWANFLASMKAYLEYGIELRKGAYDFMRKKD